MFTFGLSDRKVKPKKIYIDLEIDEEALLKKAKEDKLRAIVREAVNEYIPDNPRYVNSGFAHPHDRDSGYGRYQEGYKEAITSVRDKLTKELMTNVEIIESKETP